MHRTELLDITEAIQSVDAAQHRVKESREKTMSGRMLYSPKKINAAILGDFLYTDSYGWKTSERKLEIRYETPGATAPTRVTFTADGLKNRVALEIQLGKYTFVEYDTCAKLPIFKRFGRIECAIEVIPMGAFRREMSTGPGWFERTATILANRGFTAIDVPILLLGIDV